MRAKFIGANGSLGFRHGQWYRIDSLENRNGFVLLSEHSGFYCLYSNSVYVRQKFLKNLIFSQKRSGDYWQQSGAI